MGSETGNPCIELRIGKTSFAGEVDDRDFVRRAAAEMGDPVVIANRQSVLHVRRSCVACFLRAFSLADEGSYGDAVLRGVAGAGLFGPARRMAQLRDLAARFARGLLSNFPYPPMRGRRE